MLKWKFFRYKTVAVSWLFLMCILFFLPGSALPKESWLDAIHFDKIVHIGLFAALVFLWRSSFNWEINHYGYILLLMAVAYGFLVEVIQLYWVSNRSFDLYDVAADTAGSLLGLFIWWRVYKK